MNILKKCSSIILKHRTLMPMQRCSSNLYSPDYLEYMKPEIPLYEAVNIEMRGYDFAVLESYQKLLNSLATKLDLNVEDGWATPHQTMKVTTLKPRSEIINSTYELKWYCRTIQLTEVSAVQLPLFIRVVERCCPSGVTINVLQHEQYHDEVRYIPDKELLEIKQVLDDMGGPRKTK